MFCSVICSPPFSCMSTSNKMSLWMMNQNSEQSVRSYHSRTYLVRSTKPVLYWLINVQPMGWLKKQSKNFPCHSNSFLTQTECYFGKNIYCWGGIWVLKEEFDSFRTFVSSMMCCWGEFMIPRRDQKNFKWNSPCVSAVGWVAHVFP